MFSLNSKIRLIFSIFYLLMGLIITLDVEYVRPYWLKIFCILMMLFGIYISLVKSGVLEDKKVKYINNNSFDFISLIIVITVVYEMVRLIF